MTEDRVYDNGSGLMLPKEATKALEPVVYPHMRHWRSFL